MGKFTNVKVGDKVYVTLRTTVTEFGTDKNGRYMQTDGNRFYEDQPTLKKVRVTEAAPSFAHLLVGTVIQFRDDIAGITWTVTPGGGLMLNGIPGHNEPAFGNEAVAATMPYDIIYMPGDQL